MTYKRSSDYIFSEVSEKMVMMNVITGAYVTLNETGESIWKLLETEKTFTEIIESLASEYDASSERIEIGVKSFLDSMVESKVILFD